jgi:hypothetical protein
MSGDGFWFFLRVWSEKCYNSSEGPLSENTACVASDPRADEGRDILMQARNSIPSYEPLERSLRVRDQSDIGERRHRHDQGESVQCSTRPRGKTMFKQLVVATVLLAMCLSGCNSSTPVQNQVLGPARASQLVAQVALLTASPACTGTGGNYPGAVELSFSLKPPPGMLFVLTGFTWRLATPGYSEGFAVAVGLASVTDTSHISSGNSIADSVTPNGQGGAAGKSETIFPGVVALRPSAGFTHLCIFPETSGTTLTGFAFVHGYLAPDQ